MAFGQRKALFIMKKQIFYFSVLFTFFSFMASTSEASSALKLVFGGDTYFGESYGVHEIGSTSGDEPGIYDSSIKELSALPLSANWCMVNMEAPLSFPIPNEAVDKNLLHWANPDKTASTLKRHGIKAVSLANNHTMDYGPKGLLNTLATLKKWEIEKIGAGVNEKDANKPIIKTFTIDDQKVTLIVLSGYHYRKAYDTKYHFYAKGERPGVALLDVKKTAKKIKDLRKDFPEALIVISPHWGKNYEGIKRDQIKVAHKFIESGADIIFGHGPHMLQPIERYKGKWIIYSLGNFVFNTPGRYQTEKEAYPYSFIAVLELENKGKSITSLIRLYPTFSDNKTTNFKSRFVTEEEFMDVLSNLEYYSKSGGIPNLVRTSNDSFGHFLILP